MDGIYPEVIMMRYDTIGSSLIFTSAFLYAMRYVTAAIFMGPGLSSWNHKLFQSSYDYVGGNLTILSSVALVAGIVMLLIGFIKSQKSQTK